MAQIGHQRLGSGIKAMMTLITRDGIKSVHI